MGHGISLRGALALSCSARAVCLLAGFALGGVAPALAQTAANAPVNLDLGSVLATGAAGGTTDFQDMTGAAPNEAPSVAPLNSTQPTSLVNQKTIANNFIGTQSFADIATLTPSVSSIDPNGPGLSEESGPTIRGFQDGQFNVTFDGIPIGDSNDFTHHTTSFFASNDIGTEIVDRGPGTAETVGDATFGGTISVRTKDPLPVATLTPYGEYGSFYTHQEGLEYDTGAVSYADGASAVFDGEHLQSSGALTYNHQERTNLFAKVEVPVSANTTITALAMFNKLYQNFPFGATLQQEQVLGGDYGYNDNPASQSYYRYNDDHINTDMEYVGIQSNLGSGVLYDGKVYTYAYYHRDLNGDDANDYDPTTGQPYTVGVPNEAELSPGGPIIAGAVPGETFSNSYRSVGAIQRLEKDFQWGDIKTGVWFDHQSNTRYVTEVDLTDGNAPNYDPADANGGKITPANNFGQIVRLQHNQLYTFQPYGQVDYKPIEGLTLTGGVKFADFRRALDGIVNQKTELTQGYDHTWSKLLPSFEARYDFSADFSGYAQVAEGFLAPNLNTLYVSDLSAESFQPQTTWNYQTGVAYQSQNLALGADVYLVHFNNFINSTSIIVNGLPTKTFVNQGGVIYKGIEGEAAYTLGGGLTSFANAGLNKANATASNDYIGEAPQFTANFGLVYDQNGVYASIIDQLTGGEYDTNGQPAGNPNSRLPGNWYDPYNVLNLTAGYTFNHLAPHLNQVSVKLNLDNITNQTQNYFSPGTIAGGNNPAQPANSGATLYYRLPGVSAFVSASLPINF